MSRTEDEWIVQQDGQQDLISHSLSAGAHKLDCLIGRSGIISAAEKREGDGFSPAGRWQLRALFYRDDKIQPPSTGACDIPARPITALMGWCDAPASTRYNQLVDLPFAESHEVMMRDDGLYDIVVALGHNDAPPIAGFGSAIFLHCREADTRSTQGCVALFRDELCWLLAKATASQHLTIVPS